MRQANTVLRAGAVAAVLALGACGGGGGTTTSTPVTQPPTPAATITATGSGNLVVHPSLDSRFCCALESPIRITETTGGTADWNFARIQILLGGREIERFELGSDQIRAAGYGRIAASSNQLYTVIFRQNSLDFDRVDITLGFADLKDARQFTVAVPFTSFTDVAVSFTPLSIPEGGTVTPGN